MESRTERLIRVLGSREGYAVVRVLLATELTTVALAQQTRLSQAVTERTLEILSQASVVGRREGSQGAWYIEHWQETFDVFNAARMLGVAIQGTEDRLYEEDGSFFGELGEAGQARPAPSRGRRAS